jgi:hypothetical protein
VQLPGQREDQLPFGQRRVEVNGVRHAWE